MVLPTLFEIERHQEKGFQITSLKEEWEIIGEDQDNQKETAANKKPLVSSICLSNSGVDQSVREEACAMVIVHPQSEGRQHVQLNAVSVTANA